MAEKNINGRIIHKHDTEANWIKAVNFVPKTAEIIVYDADENYAYERFKIGDGVTAVNDLEFYSEDVTDDEIIDLFAAADMMPVVTDEDGNIMTDENDAILLV